MTAFEGRADKAYVNTYNEELDPLYLLTEPNTKEGALEYVTSRQHRVDATTFLDSTAARGVPSPVALSK